MTRRSLISVLASVAAAAGLLVAPVTASAAPRTAPASTCALAPVAAPAASGFSGSAVADPFSTTAPADHIAVLNGFSRISQFQRQQNLAETIAINQTASPATSRYAVQDNYGIEGPAIFNALGSRLSPAFFAALKAGELPKTSALLFGDEAVIADRVTTSKEKKFFQNPRPFEVASNLIRRYSNGKSDLYADVAGSGSYPSGHTTWGYTQAFLIASMIPEVGPQVLARGAEYGYHRIVLGVHYPLDVMGGRMLAETIASELLGDSRFKELFVEVKKELRGVLAARTGGSIAKVVACQRPYQSTATALSSYRQRAVYSFLPTGATNRAVQVPAGAENLIRAAHPGLSNAALRRILARTALPSGYPLDKTGVGGGWQRLDIARAWTTR